MASKKYTIAWIWARIGTEGNEAANKAAQQGAENKRKILQIINTPIPGRTCKKHNSDPNKNQAKRVINLSRSHLTKLMSIITGFNRLSYIQFKTNPKINPLCTRLCGEENETFWHLATVCPRLKTYRNEVYLDKYPEKVNWKITPLMDFSMYHIVYNLMSYHQDYNE